jgi:NADH-quinone oxidoreductase subunit J
MMLDLEAPPAQAFVRFWPIGIIVAGLTITLLILAVGKQHFGLSVFPAPLPKPVDYSQVQTLAMLLYSDYLLPFEIAGVVLLVAMIAAIGLTFRGPRSSKAQNIDQQVRVTKADRLKIIKMLSEKGEGA